MKRFLLSAFLVSALPASAVRAQTPMRFSVAGGMSLAIGTLGDVSDVGFDIGLRGETVRGREWGFRGDLTWDRFGARGPVDAYSYLGLAANLLHRHRGQLYEFGGLGLYNRKIAFRESGDNVSDSNLGMQFGVGLNFRSNNTFVELGLVNVFTERSNNAWFPLRFGVRF
ncbi:MAG TPA: outer membrane beta-barrel protein [Gemmatimonadaceae bacterium]|nr:outer membrane beta-barrel protein [Gemmatimonadaceae bacterium]